MKLLKYIYNLSFSWQGQINRCEYLLGLSIPLIVSYFLFFLFFLLDSTLATISDEIAILFLIIIFIVYSLWFFYSFFCLNIKRLRDCGLTEYRILILMMIVSLFFFPFVIFILSLLPSKKINLAQYSPISSSISEVKAFKNLGSNSSYLQNIIRFFNPYNISRRDFRRSYKLARKNYTILFWMNALFMPLSLIYMGRFRNVLKIYLFYFIFIYIILGGSIILFLSILASFGLILSTEQMMSLTTPIVFFYCLWFNFSEQISCITEARKRLIYCQQLLETGQYQQLGDGTWLGKIKDFEDIMVIESTIDECRNKLKKAIEYEVCSQLYHGHLRLIWH